MALTPSLVMVDDNAGKITHVDGEPNSGVKILQQFFGRQPNQSLTEFGKELKELTLDDKIQLVGGIADGTLDY